VQEFPNGKSQAPNKTQTTNLVNTKHVAIKQKYAIREAICNLVIVGLKFIWNLIGCELGFAAPPRYVAPIEEQTQFACNIVVEEFGFPWYPV